MNLSDMVPPSITAKWRVVDAKLSRYWWAFALALLFTLG